LLYFPKLVYLNTVILMINICFIVKFSKLCLNLFPSYSHLKRVYWRIVLLWDIYCLKIRFEKFSDQFKFYFFKLVVIYNLGLFYLFLDLSIQLTYFI